MKGSACKAVDGGFDSHPVLQVMKRLTINWTLRTDGRTVADDIDDLMQDPERYQRMLDVCKELIVEPMDIDA